MQRTRGSQRKLIRRPHSRLSMLMGVLSMRALSISLPSIALLSSALLAHSNSPQQSAPLPSVTGGRTTLIRMGDAWLLRGELRHGENRYPGHFLLQLETPESLLLHRQTWQQLEGDSVQFVSGDLQLQLDPPAEGDSVELQEFTRRHSRELGNLPCIGAIGIGALRPFRVSIDGFAGELSLQPAAVAQAPEHAESIAISIHEQRVWLEVEYGQPQRTGWLLLASGRGDTVVSGPLAVEQGKPSGDFPLQLGTESIDGRVAARPEQLQWDHPEGGVGATGNRLLQQLRLDIDFVNSTLRVTARTPAQYPTRDFEAIDALRQGTAPPLEAFLSAHLDARLAPDVASALWELRRSTAPDPTTEEALLAATTDALARAARYFVATHDLEQRGEALLYVLKQLVDLGQTESAIELGEEHVESLRGGTDPRQLHRLQHRLGRLYLNAAQSDQAYRYLLAASFGLGHDAAVHFDMGRLYEARGQLRRAFSRYTMALTGTETATDARRGVERVQAQLQAQAGGEEVAISTSTLEQLLAGRFPRYRTARRASSAIPKRRILCELFSNAQSRRTVAAELAAAALQEYYGPERLVVITHHLPIPNADALMNGVALLRAQKYPLTDVPLCVFSGNFPVVTGGPVQLAEEVFKEYCEGVETMLANPSPGDIDCAIGGEARGDRGSIEGHVEVACSVPTLLHIVLVERIVLHPGENELPFHYQVSRAALTADGAPLLLQTGTTRTPFSANLNDISKQLRRLLDQFELSQGASFHLYPTSLDPRELRVVAWVEQLPPDESAGDPSTRPLPQPLNVVEIAVPWGDERLK